MISTDCEAQGHSPDKEKHNWKTELAIIIALIVVLSFVVPHLMWTTEPPPTGIKTWVEMEYSMQSNDDKIFDIGNDYFMWQISNESQLSGSVILEIERFGNYGGLHFGTVEVIDHGVLNGSTIICDTLDTSPSGDPAVSFNGTTGSMETIFGLSEAGKRTIIINLTVNPILLDCPDYWGSELSISYWYPLPIQYCRESYGTFDIWITRLPEATA